MIRSHRRAALFATISAAALSLMLAEAAVAEPTSARAPVLPQVGLLIADIPTDAEGRTAYGLFLAGRSAMMLGDSRIGANYLAAAEAMEPSQVRLRDQAFTSALLAGDLDVAARISPSGEGVNVTVREAGRLVAVVRNFGAGRAREANAALIEAPIGYPHARAGLFVQPWIAAAAGDWDRALAEAPPGLDPRVRVFVDYYRALLLERRGDHAEAGRILGELTGNPQVAPLFRISHAEFLERRGRRADALAMLDAALEANPDDHDAAAARTRIASRRRAPPPPSLQESAAESLGLAAAIAMAEQANEFAVVYLRLALGLAPDNQTRLLLGRVLGESGLTSVSRETWAEVTRDDPGLYAAARQQIAWSYQEAERFDSAIAYARQAHAATPDDPTTAYGLASLLIAQENYAEALELLNGSLLNTADQTWHVRFMRGAAYESLGRVTEAEAELWAALQEQPENAEILNYLGYIWVDSGLRVHEGAEMIARAVAAEPGSGHIQDSLGWAQYRQGQYDAAVETLEIAVGLEPGNAVINDHLGDAYWQVGRRREAGFQWARALTLDADGDLRGQIEAKIEGGLDAIDQPPPVTPLVRVEVPDSGPDSGDAT